MSAVLELEDVHKWVDLGGQRIDILKGITLRVERGEFIAIMGASGSGKSTLLNLIGLLDLPSAGVLRINDHAAQSLPEDQLARLRAHSLGFIFQSFNLIPYLTARQNVELPMSYTHREDRHARSAHLLERMHLAHRGEAYPATLSGGERQRVAIARALANEPPLLLADEPTGALDSKTGADIMGLIQDLNRGGATVVLVTHDEQVARRAHRILRMRDGLFA